MIAKPEIRFKRRERMFQKGDFKYVILDLLKEKPSHGYELMRALEERFHGFYVPSAGTVYPTLQLLEDMGYVKSSELDGKKVYTITEEGIRFLNEREQVMKNIKDHLKSWEGVDNRRELHDTWHELRNLAHLMGRKMRRVNPEKIVRVQKILSRAAKKIEAILED
jgi:DNA-binding PadR family transcriptional regulator